MLKKKSVGRYLSPLLATSFLIAGPVQAETLQDPSIHVMINHQPVSFEHKPIIKDSSTLVPLRSIFELLGAQVDWDGLTQTVTASKDNTTIQLTIGKSVAFKNKQQINLLSPGIIIDNATMVPIRFVSESLGASVNWDEQTKLITIETMSNTTSGSSGSTSVPKNESINQSKVLLTQVTMNESKDSSTKVIPNELKDPLTKVTLSESKNPSTNIPTNDLKKPSTNKSINLTTNTQTQTYLTATMIQGDSTKKPEELYAFAAKMNPQFPKELADLYIKIGQDYHIRGDIAFMQMCKETNFYRFGGDVLPEQNNLAGIGATGGGEKGYKFNSLKDGVLAHIQHLYAYATNSPIPKGESLIDPRFQYVKRGIAPTWEKLGGKWAISYHYGEEIVALYNRLDSSINNNLNMNHSFVLRSL